MMKLSLNFTAADRTTGFTPDELTTALCMVHQTMRQHGIVLSGPVPIDCLALGKMVRGVIKGNVLTYARVGMLTTDDAVGITRGSLTANFTLLPDVHYL